MANDNSTTQPSILTLSFGDISSMRYLYCLIVVLGYILIIICNGTVITTIILNRSLHVPMYIFISVLCFNGFYGGSCFFPGLFVNLLQETQTISYRLCLAQVFCMHSYGGFDLTILAVMGYDRYVCICNPLRYNNIMTSSTVFKLILGAYLQPIVIFTIHVMLTVRLPLCSSKILKIYCDNWSVVRLSCIDTTLNNIFGIFVSVIMLAVIPLFTFYTYVQIFRVCVRSSKEVREKALQTCSPHLVSIVTFIFNALFEFLLYRYVPEQLPYELRVVMSLQILIVTPLLNPFMYGMRMKEIRTKITDLVQKSFEKEISVFIIY